MFWFLILLVSLAFVAGAGLPLMRVGAGGGEKHTKWLRVGSLAAICAAPLAAALIYLQVGAPESLAAEFQAALRAPADPAAEIANLPDEERVAMIEGMVEGLAARLAEEPDDVEGWRMLARAYTVMNRAEDSAAAYRELMTRDENVTFEDWRNYALALLAVDSENGANVSDETTDALHKLLTLDDKDALALFYLGFAAKERGDAVEALQYWRRLMAVLPEDAPILPQLQSLIDEIEGSAD